MGKPIQNAGSNRTGETKKDRGNRGEDHNKERKMRELPRKYEPTLRSLLRWDKAAAKKKENN